MSKKTETKVFTYKVEMIVSIFAEDEKTAKDKLDREGGFVSNREVSLLEAQSIISKIS